MPLVSEVQFFIVFAFNSLMHNVPKWFLKILQQILRCLGFFHVDIYTVYIYITIYHINCITVDVKMF